MLPQTGEAVATVLLRSTLWEFNHFFLNNNYLLISFWLCWVFIAVPGLSLVADSGGYSSLRCTDFSLQWLLLLWSKAPGAQAPGAVAHGLSCPGAWGPSLTKYETPVPCNGRWIFNHWTTKETLGIQP